MLTHLTKALCTAFVLLVAGLLLIPSVVLADILSINYPAPNDIISESARIRLNVTSDGTSANCVFSYDDVRNQSVACNGTSLVNMPNADETYRIRVTDDLGSYVEQQLTIEKPSPSTLNFLYASSIILLCGIIFWILYLFKRLAMFMVKWVDVALSFSIYFAFLLLYQLNLEYLNVPFIFDYMDSFFQGSIYALVVFPLIAYFVSSTYRSFKKKKGLTPEEM